MPPTSAISPGSRRQGNIRCAAGPPHHSHHLLLRSRPLRHGRKLTAVPSQSSRFFRVQPDSCVRGHTRSFPSGVGRPQYVTGSVRRLDPFLEAAETAAAVTAEVARAGLAATQGLAEAGEPEGARAAVLRIQRMMPATHMRAQHAVSQGRWPLSQVGEK